MARLKVEGGGFRGYGVVPGGIAGFRKSSEVSSIAVDGATGPNRELGGVVAI